MITLMLLLAMLHTGLSEVSGYEEVQNNLRMKLGKTYIIHLLLQ